MDIMIILLEQVRIGYGNSKDSYIRIIKEGCFSGLISTNSKLSKLATLFLE